MRFTQFLCRIPNKGGADGPIGKPALCSGKSAKYGGNPKKIQMRLPWARRPLHLKDVAYRTDRTVEPNKTYRAAGMGYNSHIRTHWPNFGSKTDTGPTRVCADPSIRHSRGARSGAHPSSCGYDAPSDRAGKPHNCTHLQPVRWTTNCLRRYRARILILCMRI